MRKLWPLFFCYMVLISGYAVSFPFFALYLHLHRGMSVGWVGFFLALSLVAAALAAGIGGELSDHWGRRKVMSWALFLSFLVTLFMVIAIWRAAPVALLVGIHILRSFVAHFFDPAARGWVADLFPSVERVRAYSFLRTAHNLGWALGPALGGFLAESSYTLLFLLTALCIFICWIGILVGVSEPFKSQPPTESGPGWNMGEMAMITKDSRFLSYLTYVLVLGVVMGQLVTPFSIYAREFVHLSEGQIGLLFSLNGFLVACFQYGVTTHLLKKWRLTHALALGSMIYAVGFGGVGFSTTFLHLALVVGLITMGEMAVSPSLSALTANLSSSKSRGRYLGMQGLAHQLGWALGPLMGGLGLQMFSSHQPWRVWVLLGGLGVVAARGFWIFQKRINDEEDGLPVPLTVSAGRVAR
ncbi:MAG: MFS transporter [Elusimicrobia bacterium]|nr:MFS transporter [Elusimicrobiota bacterium]